MKGVTFVCTCHRCVQDREEALPCTVFLENRFYLLLKFNCFSVKVLDFWAEDEEKKMDSKKCAKCFKTVYPVEEVKCLDKIWHKACFKCQECGMTLNMKNYKGFDKLPYCGA